MHVKVLPLWAGRIGLSQPAMSERVKKLEEAGVIEGYAAKINLAAIGLNLQAIVRIRTTHEHIQSYVTLFQSMPEILDAVRVTGDDCFVVRCAFAKPADLERVVDALAINGNVYYFTRSLASDFKNSIHRITDIFLVLRTKIH